MLSQNWSKRPQDFRQELKLAQQELQKSAEHVNQKKLRQKMKAVKPPENENTKRNTAPTNGKTTTNQQSVTQEQKTNQEQDTKHDYQKDAQKTPADVREQKKTSQFE